MQYKILASDYDNTLVPFGEGKPRQKVVKAVKKLQAAGGRFVLSTGRAYPCVNLKGQLGGIRFDYAITCNGACVVDREGRHRGRAPASPLRKCTRWWISARITTTPCSSISGMATMPTANTRASGISTPSWAAAA